ncbi:hypothetical protein [Edaphobacter aggregans]|uniref:hypothetical protein n=1 Tax=Edaphobacter aggregans TaxID=570835 RepID=UPI000556F4B3|nr:hypothetical protein [Edaphobacter aggregans]
MATQSLKERRLAAFREARQTSCAYIAECIIFADDEQATLSPVVDAAAGLDRMRELAERHGGESFTVEATARLIAEGGLYRPGFKVKVEPTERYGLLYGLTVDERGTA